ncbi:MAG: hypothetical protein NC394_05020 [Bacteroides sp.]|nr:hypothetical protein [Bacteroides sp.]
MITKILLLTAFIGHLICAWCDRLLICTPDGKFGFAQMNDNEKMSKTFEKMPLKNPLVSMLLGVLAMMMQLCGYIGLYEWIKQFSAVYAVIIIASAVLLFMPGVVHHVFCGVMEWFYIRLGRTESARQTVAEFFKKTSVTMYVCFLGQAIFAVAFFIAVVSGQTGLPQWCCIFNVVPVLAVLAPFKIAGSGNIAGAVMFLGLFLFI